MGMLTWVPADPPHPHVSSSPPAVMAALCFHPAVTFINDDLTTSGSLHSTVVSGQWMQPLCLGTS